MNGNRNNRMMLVISWTLTWWMWTVFGATAGAGGMTVGEETHLNRSGQRIAPAAQRVFPEGTKMPDEEKDNQGALIRKNIGKKALYLIFSADEFGEGAEKILTTLKEYDVRGSFFLTGNFLRNQSFRSAVRQMIAGGHYLGPHSDRHLLYVSWENRDSLLVSEKEFRRDVKENLRELKKAGVDIRTVKHYLPPYEWHNREICQWSEALGLRIIGFTPGTGTNADYATPDMANYRSSGELLERVYKFEESHPQGLAGAILLIHLGTHPDRSDKLYDHLGEIITHCKKRGYAFERF